MRFLSHFLTNLPKNRFFDTPRGCSNGDVSLGVQMGTQYTPRRARIPPKTGFFLGPGSAKMTVF